MNYLLLILDNGFVFVALELLESSTNDLDSALGVITTTQDLVVELGVGHSDPEVVLQALLLQLVQ